MEFYGVVVVMGVIWTEENTTCMGNLRRPEWMTGIQPERNCDICTQSLELSGLLCGPGAWLLQKRGRVVESALTRDQAYKTQQPRQ